MQLQRMRNVSILLSVMVLLFAYLSSHADEEKSPSTRSMSPEVEAKIAALGGRETVSVAYRNLSIFDASFDGGLRQKMTVLVKGDRISRIVPSESDSDVISKDTEVVDGGNWYATPGLIDSHVHMSTLPARLPSEAFLRRYVYGGLTTIRDMAGDARALADLSRAALINEIESPDIAYSSLMAGPSFFQDPRTATSGLGVVPGEVPWMLAIDETTDIPLAVAQARGTSATGIKIYANLPGGIVRQIIDEAHRQDMPVWTHAKVYTASPFDSIGADSVSHACMLAVHVMEHAAGRIFERGESIDMSSFSVEDPEFRRYVAALAESDTKFDATMFVYADSENQQERCGMDTVVRPVVAAVHKAGVPIIAGTDGSSPSDDPFPAIVDEMELLASVDGMSNADVIEAATINAAEAMGLGDELGSIDEGKLANLVFLLENPLESVANFRSVVLTVKRGRRFYRSDYHHEAIPDLPFPE
jgi:imidazolonepropionase-like amidohydrolase